MKRAVIYARVSSDVQKKEGTIQSQIAELKRQVKAAGNRLVKEYIDEGYSGALLDRPAMNELRADLKTDLFEVIYILNTDRIARDVAYQNIIVSEFIRYRKRFIVNGVDYVDNPENKFSLTVLGAVSELERAKIRERNERGKRHRLNQGFLLGHGHHIFGYTYTRRTRHSFPSYEVNKEEAKIVRYIFETYAKGDIAIRLISRQLQQSGIKMRNQLGQSQLKYILRNESYTGNKFFHTMTDTNATGQAIDKKKRGKQIKRDRSEWIGIPIPAIISKELFEKARARLELNQTCYRNALGARLLSTLVWCGTCDRRCFSFKRRSKITKRRGVSYQRPIYCCYTRGHGHNPLIDARVLESRTFDMIKESLLDPVKLRPHLDVFRNPDEAKKAKQHLREMDGQIKATTEGKERLLDLYVSAEVGREEYVKRLRFYDERLRSLETQKIEILRTTSLSQDMKTVDKSLKEYCKKAKTELEASTDFQTKRSFLLERITKVSYERREDDRDLIRLIGFLPMRKGTKDEARAGFELTKTISRKEAFALAPEAVPV